jgi:hypothetical protein
MNYKEDCEMLRRAGFTDAQVMYLSRFPSDYTGEYTEAEQFQDLAAYRRLQFVRWLVTTGKLTDQVA